MKTGAMVYGIVMYDFVAERADELEAKAGEAIIVIAQSNPEWFVAKPIGRLGGPGLIPVSFIEIRDMSTDSAVQNPHDAVKRAGVPRVEEWKKMAAEYKNSSITLGKFEVGGAPGQQGQQSQQAQQGIEQGMGRMSLQQGGRRGSEQVSWQKSPSYYLVHKLNDIPATATKRRPITSATAAKYPAELTTEPVQRHQIWRFTRGSNISTDTQVLLCGRKVLVCH